MSLLNAIALRSLKKVMPSAKKEKNKVFFDHFALADHCAQNSKGSLVLSMIN
jgi:hypothetical protein